MTQHHPSVAVTRNAAQDWTLWSTSARLVVTDAVALTRARRIADRILLDVERACSRFRTDSELSALAGQSADGIEVSEMLAALVERAIDAARVTQGDVDPTLGGVLDALGGGREVHLLPHGQHGDEASFSMSVATPREPGWTRISLEGRILRVPDDLRLDLGATAKAVAADLCARAIADELHCGALVSLGGDIATAGRSRDDGWQVTVRDLPDDPETTITLADGFAVATSSTQKRRWIQDGRQLHHILDPRLGLPAPPVWRSVTVAAENCYRANTLSTAAVVQGRRAVDRLTREGVAARLVDTHGHVIHLGGWPDDEVDPAPRRRRRVTTTTAALAASGAETTLRRAG
ncbi:FAD:protein FMN transferase [Frondihabitans sucicola]|uniref:FAD:protein FMN transferase n=1 Tax=Frondihabitans sucicola TaxID=1268041 RepID=A0ABM8GI51_9MICO|nr:FAD:protein FMN transferase [Frondihabitans sucicola]BDZ48051.1 FAD:protein FMN transferase [Frondihabitans sucicola]